MACFDLSLYSRIEEAAVYAVKIKGILTISIIIEICSHAKKTKTEHCNVIYEIMFAILLTYEVVFCYD